MSTADQDMFDKMLGKSPTLKKIQDYDEGFKDGYNAGWQAAYQEVLRTVADDGK